MVHIPVPDVESLPTILPSSVTLAKPQVAKLVWSAPAVAMVGFECKLTFISS